MDKELDKTTDGIEVRIKKRLNEYKKSSHQYDNVAPYWLNPFSYYAYTRKRWLAAAKREEADKLEERLMKHLDAKVNTVSEVPLGAEKLCVDAYWVHEAGDRVRQSIEEDDRLNRSSWMPWNFGRRGLFHEALEDCLQMVNEELEPTREQLVDRKFTI